MVASGNLGCSFGHRQSHFVITHGRIIAKKDIRPKHCVFKDGLSKDAANGNYHLIQSLKGYNQCRKYLHRLGLDVGLDPKYAAAPEDPDTLHSLA